MKPLDALRGRLAHLPATVLRRTDSAAARAAILADVRAVFPEVPRDADADYLIRHARRQVLTAARDEFAREGVSSVHLPAGWGRAELRRVDLAGDTAFHGFVEELTAALEIAPSALARDDALELRDGPFSADAYGFSLETSADLASYLLSRAWLLQMLEVAESAGEMAGRRVLTAGTEPAPADEQEFFDAEAAHMREQVRDRLVRLVRVPLELRAAVDRHERIESAAAASRGPAGADGVRTRPMAGGTEAGAPHPGRAEESAGGRARRASEDLAKRASSAAFEFAQSEAGRTAFSKLRDGAGKAYGLYGRRGGDSGTARRRDQGPRQP